MKVAVWDTYVPRRKTLPSGSPNLMHFDILVPDGTSFETVQSFGKSYLTKKDEAGQPLTTNECRFCHLEEASVTVTKAIESDGFAIIEMEGC